MSALDAYKNKRDFSQTPEPAGDSSSHRRGNRFVIQKHMARREHYDFRIEVGDVLVSWAIPKQPVTDPEKKRLAVKTEDHPLEYIHFEGTIPKGNYGAGTMMVWDYGYYYSADDGSLLSDDDMAHMLQTGKVKLHLQGQKLKGSFSLVKISKSEKEEWLFMKNKSEQDIDYSARSALTGRTMEEIEMANATVATEKEKKDSTAESKNQESPIAHKKDFPGFVSPMLATPVEDAFSDKEWIYELKLDGYRLIAARQNGSITLYSRNGNDYSEKFPLVAQELKNLKADFVVDGEICYMVNDRPDFQKLQNDNSRQDQLHYYVFDILWLNGHDLKDLPLIKRKELLETLLAKPGKHIHYLEHIDHEGEKFFNKIREKNMEGIIAKNKASTYHPGWRSAEWLKIKNVQRQEMIICGFIASGKNDREFRSLLCGVHAGEKLIYTGKVGTGFSQQKQKNIMKLLSGLIIPEAPVENPPNEQGITWVKPELVCEVKFTEWTNEKVMRHPSFIALRNDKTPRQVQFATPIKTPPSKSRVTLSNPGKIFWPEEKIRKRDVFIYYESIAPVILPYLRNRPQSLYRTPDGIGSKGFFQKNVEDLAPRWAETVTLGSDDDKTIEYLLCQDIDTLLFMVNLGCIEINPWNAAMPQPDNPDLMVFDLDPLDIDFSAVTDVALEFRKLFDQLKMPSFCKTSGGRGLHIYIPIQPDYSHRQIQNFAKTLEMHVHKTTRSITSLERSPSKRKGKIYLDYLQNGKGKTMASVYSIRPRPGAPVSTPLLWEEVNQDLDPLDFNIHTVPERIQQCGDPWKELLTTKTDLKQIISRMQ